MTIFRIGTKVRLARPTHVENEGWEGHIVDLRFIPKGSLTPLGPVPFDCNSTVQWNHGSVTIQHTDQLEPILYDGNKLVDWETCNWQPDKETIQ